MPVWAKSAAIPELAGLAFCAAGLIVLTVLMVRQYLRNRITADEHERRRLHALDRTGKVGDGEIIEFDGDSLVYSWHVAGVGYTGAQDTKALKARLPEDLMATIGPVSVKFDPRNPANSMVISELWSGFRFGSAAKQSSDPRRSAPSLPGETRNPARAGSTRDEPSPSRGAPAAKQSASLSRE
jgi:hypothetical protein